MSSHEKMERGNGMLCQAFRGAVIFVSLQHFIAPALDLLSCLPSRQRREALVGLTVTRPVQEPLAVLNLDNRI